jgi:SM-20-related protein
MQESLEFVRLNAGLDVPGLNERFAREGRVQVRDVLERDAAERLARLLIEKTPWGLAWGAGEDRPHIVPREQLMSVDARKMQEVGNALSAAMSSGDFAYIYSQFSAPAGSDYERLVAELNNPSMIDFARAVSGIHEINWCTAQVTHFGRTQFLSVHQDIDGFEGDNRLVAYVLNLPPSGWRPDWGGYLNFFNEDGDIVHGFAPRFNSLNLFRVPQLHNVSYVTPFAAADRLAVTGWFRSGDPAL